MKNWKKSCQTDKPMPLKKKHKITSRLILVLAAVFCLTAAIMSLCFGAAGLSFRQLLHALFLKPDNTTANTILWLVRLPRTAACLLSGAGLAVSGAVIQGVLANKLASPSIIGVNAGAGLAVTVCCAAGILYGWVIAGAAFCGALAAALLVTFTAHKTGASRTTVILGGVAVNTFLNALSEGIRNLIPDTGAMSADFRTGGFSSIAHTRLISAGVLILIALLLLFTLCNDLDIIALGEDTAQGLGLSVKRMRIIFLLLAAMLAGASVSFAGLLSFVGLIVPHAARILIGNESRKLLPLCALGGAGFVTICDLTARLISAPYELPAGIIMSLLGGPFFIFLLWKRKGKQG